MEQACLDEESAFVLSLLSVDQGYSCFTLKGKWLA